MQRPHPPIVVGGASPAAYRRAVRSADGWYGVFLDLDETASALAAWYDGTDVEELIASVGETMVRRLS